MRNNVQVIQTELQRRFSLTYKETKDKNGNTFLVVDFPRVYDYIDYIESNYILNQLMSEENERRLNYSLWSLSTDKNKPKQPPIGTDISVNQWYNYDNLLRQVYEKIYYFNTTGKITENNLWGIAYMISPLEILKIKTTFRKKFKIILNRIKRGKHEFQQDIKDKLCNVHYRMLNLLAEYDARPESEKQSKPANPTLKQLGIKADSKWQDLLITFKSEFEIKLKHKKEEIALTHEHLGFADNRTPNLTRAKSSWELLRLLAVGGGVFPLSKLGRREKAKRKKQKQELNSLLKKYFQIKEDPFYPVDKENIDYKIKIKLIPEVEFKDDWKDRNIYEEPEKQGTSFLIDV